MDHQEAAREQLVERYLLGELSSPLADEFEAHLFECPQCSEGLRAAAILQDNARTAFRAEVNRPPGVLAARRSAGGKAPGIRSWLPAWIGAGPAAPALAALALLAVVSYQNLVQIPRLSTELEAAAKPRVVASYSLAPVTRGDEQILTAPPGARSLMVTFDLTTVSDGGYVCLFSDDAGREWLKLEAPYTPGTEMLTLQLDPARIPAGRNLLTVRTRNGVELSRFRFTYQP